VRDVRLELFDVHRTAPVVELGEPGLPG
jgi:hypothetical protein